MKLQFLGDAKDSFKWDYHDYLTDKLGFEVLNILLMMTPDDKTNHGKLKATLFPARKKIILFCKKIRAKRNVSIIETLPSETGASYKLNLHKPDIYLTKQNRKSYYTEFIRPIDQVVFLDPDTGLEPEGPFNEKHVRYSEISDILNQISTNSVVSVFQHFRRIKFAKDFTRIRERLLEANPSVKITAIYWHQLMFVLISKSKETIKQVLKLNEKYSAAKNASTRLEIL